MRLIKVINRNGKLRRKDRVMNDAQLESFRRIAEAMQGPESRDWQWIGQYASQRMFGITEARAKACAERHGGVASRMDEALETWSRFCGLRVDIGLFGIKAEIALVQGEDGLHKLALIVKDAGAWASSLKIRSMGSDGFAIVDVPQGMWLHVFAEARRVAREGSKISEEC